MPIRPLLEIRNDLIDTLVSQGVSLYEALRVADSVISSSGQAQNPTLINLRPFSPSIEDLRNALEVNRRAGIVPVLPPGIDFVGMSTHAEPSDFIHPAAILSRIPKKTSGKPPMWEGGPPQPGWLVPRMILARRETDQLYVVIGVYDKVHLKRVPGPPPEAFITEYRNLHYEWQATEYLFCDDCRYNDLSETICEDCAKRRLRRTGCDRWDLPKFCTESFDDQVPLIPTRFERARDLKLPLMTCSDHG